MCFFGYWGWVVYEFCVVDVDVVCVSFEDFVFEIVGWLVYFELGMVFWLM